LLLPWLYLLILSSLVFLFQLIESCLQNNNSLLFPLCLPLLSIWLCFICYIPICIDRIID
ncbi:unnamed protein product, partial [Prunus brigantina]